MLLEVIVLTVDDARAAAAGGADRLEVVRDIRNGGLTPPPALVEAIASATTLPLRVMVRENAGYGANDVERLALRRAASDIASIGVDGLVAGFARGGDLSIDDLSVVIDAAPGIPMTFHRAFDALDDPESAIAALAAVPSIDRILTSGGDGTAAERSRRLRRYSAIAGRLAIIAGGGVDDESVALFAQDRCVREIHVGRAARNGLDPEAPVSTVRVRQLRNLLDA